jgi:hypothetical protein
MKLSITELCRRVGDENIQVQSLNQNLASVNVGKRDATVAFYTDKATGQNWASAVALGQEPQMACLILWIPKEMVKAAMEETA